MFSIQKKSCLNLYIDKKRNRNIAAAVQSLVYTYLSQMSLLHHRIFHELIIIIIIVMYSMHRRFSQSSALGKRKPQKSISVAVHVHFSKMIRISEHYTHTSSPMASYYFLYFKLNSICTSHYAAKKNFVFNISVHLHIPRIYVYCERSSKEKSNSNDINFVYKAINGL